MTPGALAEALDLPPGHHPPAAAALRSLAAADAAQDLLLPGSLNLDRCGHGEEHDEPAIRVQWSDEIEVPSPAVSTDLDLCGSRTRPQYPRDACSLHLDMETVGVSQPRSPPVSVSGQVLILDVRGRCEKIFVSSSSSPQALEHCLRMAFDVPHTDKVLLRDGTGCIMPLDSTLLTSVQQEQPSPGPDGGRKLTARLPKFHLEVMQKEAKASSPRWTRALSAARKSIKDFGLVMEKKGQSRGKSGPSAEESARLAEEEARYWCGLIRTSRQMDEKTFVPTVGMSVWKSEERSSSREKFFHIAAYDTSPQRIDQLYDTWAGLGEVLGLDTLRSHLAVQGLVVPEARLRDSVNRVRTYLNGKSKHSDAGAGASQAIERAVFASLWQRLMLATVCCEGDWDVGGAKGFEVKLIGYNIHSCNEASMSEEEFFFGGNLRFKSNSRESVACWARIDHAGPGRLIRMGVKFFLHPIAIEASIDAARDGMTKVDVIRHQYFASLETYALEGEFGKTGGSWMLPSRRNMTGEPPPVSECVVRSTLFLVATGNPKKGHRDWFISIVNAEECEKQDPLDRFRSGTDAADKILDGVRRDLLQHGRLREYQADYLLYTVVDRAASECLPICRAYGHRLRWLQRELDLKKNKVPASYMSEVSKLRLELQELQQWVGQMKSVVVHLEQDCKGLDDGTAVSWTFGAWASGSGKSLLLFLRGTQETLERATDQLKMLDDLARNFTQDHERYRDGFMNQTLFMLTVATVVFLPAQFITGVYGMNFVDEDGNPAFHELRLGSFSYLYFWPLVAVFIVLGSVFAWRLLHFL